MLTLGCNISTGISDLKPQPGVSVPAGGCGAVDGLARGLAVDLAPAGVRVNLVSPGAVSVWLFLISTDAHFMWVD